jgi:GNAT superfamily N-acetyltransferase
MNHSIRFEEQLRIGSMSVTIRQEGLSAEEYIDFLKRSDLGKQYPKEDFLGRIHTLVQNVQISLVARTEAGQVIGVCFGLTDFAYWLFLTDLGVDRAYQKKGIGRKLMETAQALAGGEKKIIQFAYANRDAIGFYEKSGMRQSRDMMEKVLIDWTEFDVAEEYAGPG